MSYKFESLDACKGKKAAFQISQKLRFPVSGKKNVRLIGQKTSLLSDKKVPLLCTTPLEISRGHQNNSENLPNIGWKN